MLLSEFINYFKNVKQTGENQYISLCPAHNDKHPSLSIGYSTEKKHILLHCHAGCSVENILTSVGLTAKDLYEQKGTKKNMNNTIYTYHKADGTVAYKKTRIDYDDGSKKFFFEQPNGQKNLKNIQRELYNLPEVLRAEKIYFVEGEKCAEAVIRQGFVATTLDSGAKSPWCSHYNDYLRDKEVIIIPDNDSAGITYADMIQKNIPQAKIIELPEISEKGDIFDWLNMGHTIPELDTLPVYNNSKQRNKDDKDYNESLNIKETQAMKLMRLLEKNNILLFHDLTKTPFVSLNIDGHLEIWSVESEDFKTWLQGLFYTKTNRALNKDSLSETIAILTAKAKFDSKKSVPLKNRVAKDNNAFWYDLVNDNWQAIKITENGWSIESNPPLLFYRYSHQLNQCEPEHGGDIFKIFDYINISNRKILFLCWLVCCFIPDIPHAMPIFYGEKGAAKTTTCVLLKKIIDPSSLETLNLQKDERALIVNLQKHWFLPFDNISSLSTETSDTLCRAITGGGIQQRKLYTNADDYIFTFKRCLAINGINNVAERPDLLDRSILIELSRISEDNRKELSEIMDNFTKDLPSILGGIFDILAKAMKIYPQVKLEKKPRMADFARWGYAVGEALGEYGERFINEYIQDQAQQNIEVLNSDVVAILLIAFMKDKADWEGYVSELYKELSKIAPEHGINTKLKPFPNQPNVLSRRMNSLKSNLKSAGIIFTTKSESKGTLITINNEKISPLPTSNCKIDFKMILGDNDNLFNFPIEDCEEFEDDIVF